MFILLLFLGTLFISYVIHKYVARPIFYWRRRNVPHKIPYPFVGNIEGAVLLKKKTAVDSMISMYNEFPNERYYGLFQFNRPTLFIRDLDIIKNITVKDFEHFTDHGNINDTPIDPILKDNLIQLQGDKWKEVRSIMSPAFTSSKMKNMFGLMTKCAENLTDYLGSKEEAEIELKDLFTRYSNDVIATCGFGVTCDSFKDKDNSFFKMGAEIMNVTKLKVLKILMFLIFPKITKILNISYISKEVTNFFSSNIKESIKYRINNKILRPDIIHLLLEARKGKLQSEQNSSENDFNFSAVNESDNKINETVGGDTIKVDDDFIVAQSFIFFLAGFDTSSYLLAFLVSELAINVEVQERLFDEINEAMKKTNGNLSYNDIAEMKYMDMVVSETLRKWPPALATDRDCTKKYTILASNPTQSNYTISVGESITIPILGLHRSEIYFPNPEKFDPERFSDENKKNIVPYSYLPFGVGPRACIGSRFALLETKIIVAQLLAKFEVIVVKKTSVPLKISPKEMTLQPENGFWVGIKKRPINL